MSATDSNEVKGKKLKVAMIAAVGVLVIVVAGWLFGIKPGGMPGHSATHPAVASPVTGKASGDVGTPKQ